MWSYGSTKKSNFHAMSAIQYDGFGQFEISLWEAMERSTQEPEESLNTLKSSGQT